LPSSINHDWSSDWVRQQVSLAAWVGQTVRLRFQVSGNYAAPDTDVFLDKITLQESPLPVTLNPLDQITVSSLRLTWTEAAIPNFKEYRIYRSETGAPDENSTLLTIITNQTATAFTDTGLTSRKTYLYRVYLYDSNDTGVPSNQASTMTAGVPNEWADDFESAHPAWTFTGNWTRWPGVGRDGSTALVDSPGDYPNNSQTHAQFGLDLNGLRWPVFKFHDRHAFADNDWGRVYVSGNGGVSWMSVYSASATRTNWAEQTIDLSPWRNQSQVWVRFQVNTDGSSQNDGWYLDDLSVSENHSPVIAYPFHETFEHGLGNWLSATWAVDTNQPFAGRYAVRDTPSGRMTPDTALWLVLANDLSLSNAINPQLTFWLRGQLGWRSYFRVQASTDGGLNWTDLPAGQDHDWSSDWVKRQVSLLTYTNRSIRLRFQTSCNYAAPETDVFIDNIGIGEPAPGAPTLAAPANLASVNIARPVLAVTNAVDFQGDSLSYRFEVYADAELSNLAAQVPLVASGAQVTSWQVDTDLPNNAQYWWRCQASDGTNTGPWMAAASFYVNETNHPPSTPLIAGPPSGTLVTSLETLLVWFPASDPDEGDNVATYHIQVATDAAFLLPVINATQIPAPPLPPAGDWALTLPLSALPGADELIAGMLYHWRISAQDLRGMSSGWSAGLQTFQFGLGEPRAGTITAFRRGAGNEMILEWSGAAGSVYVEFTYGMNPPQWHTVAGPLQGTTWSFSPLPGTTSGFYRLRSE
ncbi:MAG: hypothetical protein IH623_21635, partial [Verrucomicrobia bacterium]|nr:hypothetical protein [Verrucomicrobiota bacterium]